MSNCYSLHDPDASNSRHATRSHLPTPPLSVQYGQKNETKLNNIKKSEKRLKKLKKLVKIYKLTY